MPRGTFPSNNTMSEVIFRLFARRLIAVTYDKVLTVYQSSNVCPSILFSVFYTKVQFTVNK